MNIYKHSDNMVYAIYRSLIKKYKKIDNLFNFQFRIDRVYIHNPTRLYGHYIYEFHNIRSDMFTRQLKIKTRLQ